MEEFRKELEALINKYSLENSSNTPDFILAEYLANCLAVFNSAVIDREGWYGRNTLQDFESQNYTLERTPHDPLEEMPLSPDDQD